jgi:hypothetical protein
VRMMLFRGSFYLCIPAAARCQDVEKSFGGLELEIGILEVEARNAYQQVSTSCTANIQSRTLSTTTPDGSKSCPRSPTSIPLILDSHSISLSCFLVSTIIRTAERLRLHRVDGDAHPAGVQSRNTLIRRQHILYHKIGREHSQ